MGGSAFDDYLPNVDILNICIKEFDARKIIFDRNLEIFL